MPAAALSVPPALGVAHSPREPIPITLLRLILQEIYRR
jgi:hypothetical protein